jgi:citrate lyase subunit alpha/citrate CoA-transferase
LLEAVKGTDLPIRGIRDIQREVNQICGGKPRRSNRSGQVVAVVKWVDGTVLDSVWKVER